VGLDGAGLDRALGPVSRGGRTRSALLVGVLAVDRCGPVGRGPVVVPAGVLARSARVVGVLGVAGGAGVAGPRGVDHPSRGAARPPIPSPGSTSDRIGALVGAFGHARYLNVPGENLSPAATATARRTPIGRTRMRSLLEAADIARPLSAPPENPLTLGARFGP